MELKQSVVTRSINPVFASNCTNMELKPFTGKHVFALLNTSNCTNMELKLVFWYTAISHFCLLLIAPIWNWNHLKAQLMLWFWPLLIAPIWNWNLSTGEDDAGFFILLIAPIWNWNLVNQIDGKGEATPSNCTNMELKQRRRRLPAAVLLSSNCTNMELKPFTGKHVFALLNLLIAPIWNWNYPSWYKSPTCWQASNCTNMELKHRSHSQHLNACRF